ALVVAGVLGMDHMVGRMGMTVVLTMIGDFRGALRLGL
ncbi:hypothetical protein ACVWWH_002123, partial [Sinomonas sp. RB5]